MNKQHRRPPGRPRANEQSQSTRYLILKTAARLFLDHGYPMVSIDDIANACQVTKATVYYYFSSKAELFTETMIQLMNRINDRIQLILSEDLPLYDRLIKVTEAHLKATYHIDLDKSFMQGGTKDTLSDEQIKKMQEAEECMRKGIEKVFTDSMKQKEIAEVNPLFSTHVYLSLLQVGNVRDKNNTPIFPSVKETAEHIVQLLWKGLFQISKK
ncbi:transcriptional regulator [Gracilibacillus boraciitolerans JCM 21714]|uniref:Transcriptional regulator n=1 Tax=Gracilibacillus boraciitolerans JCM 21714 TaxID=1298598 RepID=W4VI89_9BACI|nr:TetR/AcrR family transcriptional regulator [Gracilibacillus boraciitolerans]GAE92912.1 transcriptional regulator [Gracilibacillus boraciitolerans JCM 21714]